MWSVHIVMVHEDGEDTLEMPSVENQHAVDAFRANGADESLRDAVCLRRSKWRPNNLDAFALKHRVEAPGELLISVANQKTKRARC